jgi:hypothetical protein
MKGSAKSPPHILELADRVLQAAADPRYDSLKEIWTGHNRLERQRKTPVSVFLHGGYTNTWRELIPPEELV